MQTSGAFMRPVASSFPLQICLSLSIYFCPAWWALTFSLLIYKGSVFPYPPTALGFEIATTFIIYFIQYWGVRLSKRGNLTEQTGTLGVGVVLLLMVVGGLIFYALGQTYVMRLDQGFSVTFLILDGLCIILAVAAMQGFAAPPAPAAFAGPPPPARWQQADKMKPE